MTWRDPALAVRSSDRARNLPGNPTSGPANPSHCCAGRPRSSPSRSKVLLTSHDATASDDVGAPRTKGHRLRIRGTYLSRAMALPWHIRCHPPASANVPIRPPTSQNAPPRSVPVHRTLLCKQGVVRPDAQSCEPASLTLRGAACPGKRSSAAEPGRRRCPWLAPSGLRLVTQI